MDTGLVGHEGQGPAERRFRLVAEPELRQDVGKAELGLDPARVEPSTAAKPARAAAKSPSRNASSAAASTGSGACG